MKGQKIKQTIIHECDYELGDCKYKNPDNKYKCYGCRWACVVEQTPPELLNDFEEVKQQINHTVV